MTDRELLEEIDEHVEDCDSWETGFVESCLEWTESGRPLTERQRETAENILDKLDTRAER